MSDSMLERYKNLAIQAEEERAERYRREEEEKEAERQRLIATIPDAVEQMFERQEGTDYADEVVKGHVLSVQLDSTEVKEAVVWPVGYSRYRRLTAEEEERDVFYISYDRVFVRSSGYHVREGKPFIQFAPDTLNQEELRDLIKGIDRVGRRRSEIETPSWRDR